MKIIIQLFRNDKEADEIEWAGDAVGNATSWKEAHELIDLLKQGHTIPKP